MLAKTIIGKRLNGHSNDSLRFSQSTLPKCLECYIDMVYANEYNTRFVANANLEPFRKLGRVSIKTIFFKINLFSSSSSTRVIEHKLIEISCLFFSGKQQIFVKTAWTVMVHSVTEITSKHVTSKHGHIVITVKSLINDENIKSLNNSSVHQHNGKIYKREAIAILSIT